jgi:hypothetical protein
MSRLRRMRSLLCARPTRGCGRRCGPRVTAVCAYLWHGQFLKVPRRAWQKLSAGAGAKGHRFYDWAVIDLAEPRPGSHRLLVRRNRTTGELACHRCVSPAPAPLTALVRVAGSRWRVEETFQAGKGQAGLDEHQARRYTSWTRWVTLAMLAHAFRLG